MIPGLRARVAPSSVPVLRIHYSADPAKRPGTPAGDAWLAETETGYPGGRRSPRWRKEMEMEYGALGGAALFPDWEVWSQGPIVCAPFDPIGWRLYGSYDHGWHNPASFHVHAVSPDGEIVTLWEFYADKVGVPFIAQLLKGQDVTVPHRPEARVDPGRRHFEGNPFGGALTWIVADPSMWAESGTGAVAPMADAPHKSTAELFRRYGVHLQRGERGGDTTVAEWLLGHFWADPGRPRYRIARTCPWLIWEIGEQRYREISERQALSQDAPEALRDKDNHGWDGLKMFLKRFPPSATAPKPAEKPATFEWWRKQARRAKDGQPAQSYQRAMVT